MNKQISYGANNYYHAFNRGVEKRTIFIDEQDYFFFLSLLARYLGDEEVRNSSGILYANYSESVELLAYALMPNHFHLLFYMKDDDGLRELMHDISTSYARYFNDKYKRVGPLFQGRFKASLIIQESYLQHISRYIHLNPKDWRTNPYTSLPYWLGEKHAAWLTPDRLLPESPHQYLAFVEDYQDYKRTLDAIKADLAV